MGLFCFAPRARFSWLANTRCLRYEGHEVIGQSSQRARKRGGLCIHKAKETSNGTRATGSYSVIDRIRATATFR